MIKINMVSILFDIQWWVVKLVKNFLKVSLNSAYIVIKTNVNPEITDDKAKDWGFGFILH